MGLGGVRESGEGKMETIVLEQQFFKKTLQGYFTVTPSTTNFSWWEHQGMLNRSGKLAWETHRFGKRG